MRKTIGNILFIIGFVSLVLVITLSSNDMGDAAIFFVITYAVGIFGGIALRIGDFFKWRAKKFQEGINEAKREAEQAVSGYCPHCGKPLSSTTAFCPHCGKALN